MKPAETILKPAKNGKDPVITDLNMTIGNMIIGGMTKSQVARELGVDPATITHHVNRLKTLTESKIQGEITDPINNHRARLMKRLRKGEKVIDYTLKPKTFKKNHQQLAIANTMTIAMYKGLGVLVDKTEVSGQVDLLAQRRSDMQARIEAMRQFGLNPSDELPAIMAEVVEEVGGADTASGKSSTCEVPPVSAQAKAASPDTSELQPDASIISEGQPIPTTPIAPEPAESSQDDADKPQAKPPRQTLSKSKW